MVAPTFVSQGISAFNTNTTPKTLSIAVQPGDTLVVFGLTNNDLTTISTPSDGVNTYLPIQSIVITDFCWAGAWKTTPSTAVTLTVSATRGGTGGDHWGIGWYLHRNSGGVGASSKTNTTGAPSLALTTGSANSAILNIVGDWNAIDGTSTRVWRTINSITPSSGAGTEALFLFDSGLATSYSARWTDAGAAGSKTTGLSAPTGQKYSIIAIEILPPAGGSDVTATDTPGGMRLGSSPATVTANVTVVDTPSGMRLGTSPANASVDVSAADTPSGMRLGASPATTTIIVGVTDTPSGMRLGSSPASVVSDVVVSDVPSGVRLGQSASTVSVGVTTTDAPSGMRMGVSPTSVFIGVAIGDTPSGMRLGSSSALVTYDMLVPDNPSGMRLGVSPIAGVLTDSGATDAFPSGMRLGQSPATAIADIVVVDPSHAGMRMGQSPAVVGTAVFAGDVPSGMRLGQSTATVVVDALVLDSPNGLRLGGSPATVAVSTVAIDAPSGMRLGLSPATVTIGSGGTTPVTVFDSPSGMRLGQSPVQVIVSVPPVVEPTIFVDIGVPLIDARSRPFVYDVSVGVNIHAVVGEVFIVADTG